MSLKSVTTSTSSLSSIQFAGKLLNSFKIEDVGTYNPLARFKNREKQNIFYNPSSSKLPFEQAIHDGTAGIRIYPKFYENDEGLVIPQRIDLVIDDPENNYIPNIEHPGTSKSTGIPEGADPNYTNRIASISFMMKNKEEVPPTTSIITKQVASVLGEANKMYCSESLFSVSSYYKDVAEMLGNMFVVGTHVHLDATIDKSNFLNNTLAMLGGSTDPDVSAFGQKNGEIIMKKRKTFQDSIKSLEENFSRHLRLNELPSVVVDGDMIDDIIAVIEDFDTNEKTRTQLQKQLQLVARFSRALKRKDEEIDNLESKHADAIREKESEIESLNFDLAEANEEKDTLRKRLTNAINKFKEQQIKLTETETKYRNLYVDHGNLQTKYNTTTNSRNKYRKKFQELDRAIKFSNTLFDAVDSTTDPVLKKFYEESLLEFNIHPFEKKSFRLLYDYFDNHEDQHLKNAGRHLLVQAGLATLPQVALPPPISEKPEDVKTNQHPTSRFGIYRKQVVEISVSGDIQIYDKFGLFRKLERLFDVYRTGEGSNAGDPYNERMMSMCPVLAAYVPTNVPNPSEIVAEAELMLGTVMNEMYAEKSQKVEDGLYRYHGGFAPNVVQTKHEVVTTLCFNEAISPPGRHEAIDYRNFRNIFYDDDEPSALSTAIEDLIHDMNMCFYKVCKQLGLEVVPDVHALFMEHLANNGEDASLYQ